MAFEVGAMTLPVLDLSHFQGDEGSLDYARVRQSVSAAYIKLTQATTYEDPRWRQHWTGLAGIPRGGYHFCGRMDGFGQVTYQDPTQEAQAFATVLGRATWELRPVVDIEAPGANPAWLKTFLAALRAASGIQRLRVYTSYSLIRGVLEPSTWLDPDTDLWVARYNTSLDWDHPALKLWQYSSTAIVPGILGYVDLSAPMHGWTPTHDTAGGFLMALTDAEQAEILAGIRALKPGVRLPARSPNCGPGANDDAFGSALNAWAAASDARAVAAQALAEVRALRAQLAPPR